MSSYPHLFSSIQVGKVRLKNRVVMPPMDTNYAEPDGRLGRKGYAYLLERARGGVGLIIVEASSIDWPRGKISVRQYRMDSHEITPEWFDLIESVHSFGTKIICQLHHGGCVANPTFSGGAESIAPSKTGGEGSFFPSAREMTKDDIERVIGQHVQAAVQAKKCGFDGVEVHAAHCYIINQFLSPIINHRTDEYGGSLENRMRILQRVVLGIREACGAGFLLSVRLACEDSIPGGITLEEGKSIAKACEESGADLINCSTGFYASVASANETQYDQEGPRLRLSKAIKPVLQTAKVAVVGKLRTPAFCDRAIAAEETDLVCIGRQLICDPFWPQKAEEGRENEIRRCLSCLEGCLTQLYYFNSNCRCSINPYVGFEDLYRESYTPAAGEPKSVLVIGGGIAGMQTAITARKRGHSVTLLEKSPKLGGQMLLAGQPPHKEDITKALSWFTGEMERLGVTVKLGAEADLQTVRQIKPDAVVVAVGSKPYLPPIPGIEKAVESWSILNCEVPAPKGKRVVIIGGGTVGAETAHLLVREGNSVTILEMLPGICQGQEPAHKYLLENALKEAKTVIEVGAEVASIEKGAVSYVNCSGENCTAPFDMLIVSTGQRPVGSELIQGIKDAGILVYSVGDATTVGNFRSATRSAFDVANTL